MSTQQTIFVTGIAGFIGSHLASRLAGEGWNVVGLDNLNAYYDPTLKVARLRQLGLDVDAESLQPRYATSSGNVVVHVGELSDKSTVNTIFREHAPDVVCNLAAQAGVRYSLENPDAYIASNIVGFGHILEACRHFGTKHLVYASSSSVYGTNSKIPFSTSDQVDHPASLYAATKKSNELMAHCYSHLFSLPTTGLRFFTVYGPWGRPDMACFLFSDWIRADKPIKIFNHGNLYRDFTYIDDIVEGITRVLPLAPSHDGVPGTPTYTAPYRVLNIGNGTPVHLMEFIHTLERELGVEAKKEFLDMQPGDVEKTWADTSELRALTGFSPDTSHEEGLRRFTRWYKEYYGIGDL